MEKSTNFYRKMLTASIASTLLVQGADSSEWDVLETLTEMLQAFISEVGNLSKNYCELSGRTEPIIADVILGFVDMGINFNNLNDFIKKYKHNVLPNIQKQQQPKQLCTLHAGKRQSLPNHIPPYFPPFPDPHSYIKTPTYKRPVIDYEAIREKFARQKRDVEKALTKFMTKTRETHDLFENDENIFPLIACKPTFPPYINALLPQDQIFDPEDMEYKTEEVDAPPKKRVKSEIKIEDNKQEVSIENLSKNEEVLPIIEDLSQNMDIDNPYLAPVKLPLNKNE